MLDDDLVAETSRLSGIKTKKELVRDALRVLIASKQRKNLLDLQGQIEFAPGLRSRGIARPGFVIVVDSSVLIAFFRGHQDPAVARLSP